jgi:Mn-dependent DtxR family transcriptional regulator
MEDYLEVIYELINKKGYATQIDISESLNVSLPSVTKMLQRLDESKYLKYENSKNIHEKHTILSEIFKMIGVDEGYS